MKREFWKALGLLVVLITLVVTWGVYRYNGNREMITDINEYEKYLGAEGKYKENYGTYNDIFPNAIPDSAQVEDFRYYYYNPWAPCYMGYLVYTCDNDAYCVEKERLLNIESSEEKYVYGAEEFPYELCAVYADDYYGYIYALADEENNRLIYVELQFADNFTDINYDKYIAGGHLPVGFDARMEVADSVFFTYDEEGYGVYEHQKD